MKGAADESLSLRLRIFCGLRMVAASRRAVECAGHRVRDRILEIFCGVHSGRKDFPVNQASFCPATSILWNLVVGVSLLCFSVKDFVAGREWLLGAILGTGCLYISFDNWVARRRAAAAREGRDG